MLRNGGRSGAVRALRVEGRERYPVRTAGGGGEVRCSGVVYTHVCEVDVGGDEFGAFAALAAGTLVLAGCTPGSQESDPAAASEIVIALPGIYVWLSLEKPKTIEKRRLRHRQTAA